MTVSIYEYLDGPCTYIVPGVAQSSIIELYNYTSGAHAHAVRYTVRVPLCVLCRIIPNKSFYIGFYRPIVVGVVLTSRFDSRYFRVPH